MIDLLTAFWTLVLVIIPVALGLFVAIHRFANDAEAGGVRE